MAELIVTGNLAGDPILRTTQSGRAVVNFRILETRRRPDGQGGWIDDEPLGLDVTAWAGLAENVAASLHRGDRVSITGRLVPTSWTQDDGQKRFGVQVVAEDVALSLRFATATPVRVPRTETAPAAA